MSLQVRPLVLRVIKNQDYEEQDKVDERKCADDKVVQMRQRWRICNGPPQRVQEGAAQQRGFKEPELAV